MGKKVSKKKARKKATKRKPARGKKARNAPKRAELPEQDERFDALLAELLPNQRAFIKAFYDEGTIADACKKVGITRQAHHGVWMRKHPETGDDVYPLYVRIFNDARVALVEVAEGQLWRMGVKGIVEPIVWQGQVTKHKLTKYSVHALQIWLKANCPEKYKERFEHTGAEGGPLSMSIEAARAIANNFDQRHSREKVH